MIIKALQIQLTRLPFLVLVILILLTACETSGHLHSVGSKQEDTVRLHKLVIADSITLLPNTGLVYYRNEPYTGAAVTYSDNGLPVMQINYLLGKRHGIYQKWFSDGTISFESHYQNGKIHGTSKSWWQNGCLRSLANHEHGIAQGEQLQWYQSGAKFKRRTLVNGKEEGLQQSWRENGKLYNNYEAKAGRIFGLKRANLCYELDQENIQYGD